MKVITAARAHWLKHGQGMLSTQGIKARQMLEISNPFTIPMHFAKLIETSKRSTAQMCNLAYTGFSPSS